jgi:hypothetical protein
VSGHAALGDKELCQRKDDFSRNRFTLAINEIVGNPGWRF